MSRFSKLLDAFESYSANLDAQTERALDGYLMCCYCGGIPQRNTRYEPLF